MNKEQMIDFVIELFKESKHYNSHKELLKRLLVDKTMFVNAIPDEAEDMSNHNYENFVGYSNDMLLIPNEMSEKEKKIQLIKYALGFINLKVFRKHEEFVVKSGFETATFIKDNQDNMICDNIKHKELNSVAKSIYSKFLYENSENSKITIDNFINLIKNSVDDKEKIYSLYSEVIGNELLFECFVESNTHKLEKVFEEKKSSFEQFADSFQKGIELEKVRKF